MTMKGPFPPAALCRTAGRLGSRLDGQYYYPSDSRCAGLDFALGSYEYARPDPGRADGPLVFRATVRTRAAPPYPAAATGAPASRAF